ncbi:MAG: hypothetical protein PHY72_00320 [Candidatus Pacebacteria bacterium]|nr:hypothetical protein [Candidatus Paceibacterota bacterium]
MRLGFDLDGTTFFWLFFFKKYAREVLKRLIAQGHEIRFVTARGILTPLAKRTLELYRLSAIEVIGVGKNGKKYKQLINSDAYFDNTVEQLIAIREVIGSDGCQLYLFGKESKGGFTNLPNWRKIYREVLLLSRKEVEKKLAV